MNHITGIDRHQAVLFPSSGVGLMMTAYNLRCLFKLIGLQVLRKAALALPAGLFRAKTGLWELAKTIFVYFSRLQSVFGRSGKNGNGSKV